MGEVTRRDFIRQVCGGLAAVALPSVSSFANTSPPLDDLTKQMFEKLGNAKSGKASIEGYRYTYWDDASFNVSADIGGYNIAFRAFDDFESLKVKSGRKEWTFTRRKASKDVFCFNCYDYGARKFQNLSREMKRASHVFARMRDLLDINVHEQDCKGRDLTSVVDTLSKKALSPREFKVEYGSDLYIEASFEEGDFRIEYEFDDNLKEVSFTIRDGKNRLSFFETYDENEKTSRIGLDVNWSKFTRWSSGELKEFPRKVYNEPSAMGIVNKARDIERYLTSHIRRIKLENYYDLFKRLASTKVDKVRVEKERRFRSVMISAGGLDIKYFSSHFHSYVWVDSGDDRIKITADTKKGEITDVVINGHPFLVRDGKIDYIRSTYSEKEAKSIVRTAKEWYRNIKKTADNPFLAARYEGQPLVAAHVIRAA